MFALYNTYDKKTINKQKKLQLFIKILKKKRVCGIYYEGKRKHAKIWVKKEKL